LERGRGPPDIDLHVQQVLVQQLMVSEPQPGPITRWFEKRVRSWTYYQAGRRRPLPSTLSERPEPDERVERAQRLIGLALAVAAPLVVCLVLVAVRNDIDRSTASLVLVLPVVLVAVVGGRVAAAVAAVVASVSFDVLLTRPYYRFEIHAAEDVEAALILLAVGFLVGQLVASETRSRVRSTARRAQVDALVAVVHATAGRITAPELADRTVAALTELLDLREGRWLPGYHGAAHPRLGRDGEVSGMNASTDRAPFAATGVELPVTVGGHELGRLILVPAGRTSISREERLVAVAIADVFGLALSSIEDG
jgi:K+-sensing histidine kinase KdpD